MAQQNSDAMDFMDNLPISPKTILIILVIIIIILALLSLTGQHYVLSGGDNELLLKAAGKMNLDGEKNNLPNWFQATLMLFSAFLSLIIAFIRRESQHKNYPFWGFISVVFFYLSLDESISIHEQLTDPLRNGLDLGGVFFMSWVVPVGIAVIIFFLLSLKFLSRLPSKIRWLMITSGAIYISGALVMEMIDGAYYEKAIEPFNGKIDWNYVLMTTVEESLESIGLAVFIFTLVTHLSLYAFKPPETVIEKKVETDKLNVKAGKPATAQIQSK